MAKLRAPDAASQKAALTTHKVSMFDMRRANRHKLRYAEGRLAPKCDWIID